jgi:hypothetical protein
MDCHLEVIPSSVTSRSNSAHLNWSALHQVVHHDTLARTIIEAANGDDEETVNIQAEILAKFGFTLPFDNNAHERWFKIKDQLYHRENGLTRWQRILDAFNWENDTHCAYLLFGLLFSLRRPILVFPGDKRITDRLSDPIADNAKRGADQWIGLFVCGILVMNTVVLHQPEQGEPKFADMLRPKLIERRIDYRYYQRFGFGRRTGAVKSNSANFPIGFKDWSPTPAANIGRLYQRACKLWTEHKYFEVLKMALPTAEAHKWAQANGLIETKKSKPRPFNEASADEA